MNILIVGNGFDLEHNIKINFQDFVNSIEFNESIKTHKKYFINSDQNNHLWSEFEKYCFDICSKNKINKQEFWKKINNIFFDWLTILKEDIDFPNLVKSKLVLKILDEFKPLTILSFNYTATPEIYEYESLFFSFDDKPENWKIDILKNKYVNLHYFDSKDKGNYVLGHDLELKYNKNFMVSTWAGKKAFNPKIKVLNEIKNNPSLSKLIFYGFSFGDSDIEIVYWLFEAFKSNEKIVIIIYTYDIQSSLEIKNNICKSLKNKKGVTAFKKSLIYINNY